MLYFVAAKNNVDEMDDDSYREDFKNKLSLLINKLYTKFGYDINKNSVQYWVAWDSPKGALWRKEFTQGSYKQGRKQDNKFKIGLVTMQETLPELGFHTLKLDDPPAEADDLINSFCKSRKDFFPEAKIIIVSSDKDMIQIVQKGYADYIFNSIKNDFVNIPNYDIITYKALAGDRSDNILGVRGIGDKKAKRLLESINSLNTVSDIKFQYSWLKEGLSDQDYKCYLDNVKIIDLDLNPQALNFDKYCRRVIA